jgi:hypothetical protein
MLAEFNVDYGGARPTFDDGHDGALLNCRRALEAVRVHSSEKLSLQVHGVEGVGGFVIVGLDLACREG